MPIEELVAKRITGIEPFNELPIDAQIWREAHGHHHDHRRLHAVTSHRPGIVFGLEVVCGKKERTVIVAPGVAVDADGNALLLSEPVAFKLDEKGQIYITISYEDNFDSKSSVKVGGGTKYFRLVEGRRVVATKELPKGAFLELARVDRSSDSAEIKEPKNPFDPGKDELNHLYRLLAFPHCYASGEVGELSLIPKANPTAWKPNRAGLYNLVREGNGRGFHLRFTGPFNLRAKDPESDPLILYAAVGETFQPLTDEQVGGLKRYLDNGGFVFAEAAQGAEAFAKSFAELAKKAGASLKAVGKGHPLLSAHYMFSSPPPGAQDKGKLEVDEVKGIALATFDYGAAWQGELPKPDASDARERIRQSQEFGLNVVAYAWRRRRLRELSRLG
ncbi:MAG: DUF4159 domain-containing protein [Fimbriimonadaceae bacterium]|nr:DUF4159 domain-containing protein [Fimbriimonadaceae bacterium]